MATYKAIVAHEENKKGELSIEIDDDVDRIKDIGNGWVLGRNVRTGKTGLFPENCLDRNTSVTGSIVRRVSKRKPSLPSKGPKVRLLLDNLKESVSNNVHLPLKKAPAESLKNSREEQYSSSEEVPRKDRNIERSVYYLKYEYEKIQQQVRKAAGITKEKVSDMNYKLLKSEENQFRLLKTIWRIVLALFATGILYMLLYFSFGFNAQDAGYLIIGMFIFFMVGLVFFKLIRCVMLLMVPNLFTGRGRALFLSIITGLLLAGPAVNIANNTDELSTCLGCTADLIYNQTQALRKQLEEPLYELARKLQSYMYELRLIIDGLATALEPLTSTLSDFSSAVQSALDEVSALSDVSITKCNEQCESDLTSAKESCSSGIDSAKSDCEDTLDAIDITDEAWDEVEGAIDWFEDNGLFRRKRSILVDDSQYLGTWMEVNGNQRAKSRNKRGVCDVLSVGDSICNIGSALTTLCDPFSYLENKLIEASEAMVTALDYVTEFFTFEVESDFGLSGTVNYSKNASTVLSEIQSDILSRISGVLSFITTISNVLGLTLIILFIKSLIYIKKYRTKDHFNNIFITKGFVRFDDDCKKRGEEFVLPLHTSEEVYTYVMTTTKILSPAEMKTLKTDMRLVFYHVLISTFIIGFDYILYYALDLVTQYADVALTVEGISTIDVEIEGDGIFTVILRAMVDNLNLNSTFSVDLNFTCCLPDPSYPDSSNIPVLILLYIIAALFVTMQGYGMRLRRKIASSFYPEQEVCRIHYLHEKIIHKRLTFKAWLKDHIFSKRKENEVREKISFRAYLAYKSPFFSKYIEIILPSRKSCLNCDKVGRRGMIFKKCDNKSCSALFCEDCFKFTKGHCLVCDTKNEIRNIQNA
ncbi:hypothetical protein FSP39_016738 [Pinctada imbricata]|uniref:SH3 domain-containing protein n=1 Tax=Pinctada imbricata TaxID=66713 RepID=A0AA88YPN7_PINIB|nr:hypothetical protein FSP39_016738 [Pinctada imbricata]